jgi:hypothetical protein
MDPLSSFFENLRTKDPHQLSQTLSINLTHSSQQISQLQNVLYTLDEANISQLVENQHLNDDWSQFRLLVTSYLVLCKHIDPWSILKSHDLLLSFFNQLSMAFMSTAYGELLCSLMKDTVSYIVPMMKKLDLVLNSIKGKKYKRLTFISTVLSKVFNHLRSLKGSPVKKTLIIFIVNHLNTVYFIIGSPLLCANIFANVNLLELKFDRYPKGQQVEYRYILGRYYIIKDQLYKAYYHLSWSFRNMIRGSDNLTKVLRYLIPVSLLIGRIPSKNVLEAFPELNRMYGPLIIHLMNGNHIGFQLHLFHNQNYFKSRGLLILLAQRAKIMIFRNLFLNIYKLNDINRLSYDQLQLALMKSIRSKEEQLNTFGNQYMYQIMNEQVDYAFVQNVCCSLIENDLIKGNVVASAKLVILSKANAFPPAHETYEVKFGIAHNEKWMD